MEETRATSETAKQLGIGASTLRKYAAALEEQGYVFQRSANQSRKFTAEDIACLQQMLIALREDNRTIVQAVEVVLEGERKWIQTEAEEVTGRLEPVGQAVQLITVDPVTTTYEAAPMQNTHTTQTTSVNVMFFAQAQEMLECGMMDLRRRVEELEERQNHLLDTNTSLTNQLEEQRLWIKEKLEEERDRQLITNLRTYQGRQRKSRGSFLAWLGITPRKRREA